MRWTLPHIPLTRVARAKLAAATMLLFIPAIGIYGGYYLEKEGLAPTLLGRQRSDRPVPRLIGPPVQNQLKSDYKDANGDLVADPPSDPGERLNPARLVLVVMPVGQSENPGEHWAPLVEHLRKAVGMTVRLEIAGAQDGYRLLALREGEVHVALIGAGAVPLAVNAAGFVPVGMLPGDDGSGFTRMVILVPQSSAVTSPMELRGRQLLFVDPTSNTGFKAAVAILRDDFGMRPERDFTWTFSGSAQESIRAIKDQRAIAVAVAADVLSEERAAGRIAEADYRVIFESERYPTTTIGMSHRLAAGLAGKVRSGILSFDWKSTPLEADLGKVHTRFVPVDYRADFWMIRRIDDATGTSHVIGG